MFRNCENGKCALITLLASESARTILLDEVNKCADANVSADFYFAAKYVMYRAAP